MADLDALVDRQMPRLLAFVRMRLGPELRGHESVVRDALEWDGEDRFRRLARREAEQRRLAQVNLDRFLVLADRVRLEEAITAERELYPALPERAPAIRAWLDERARPLAGRLPALEAALGGLGEGESSLSGAEQRMHPDGDMRAHRSGSFFSPAEAARSAARGHNPPTFRDAALGCRPMLPVER